VSSADVVRSLVARECERRGVARWGRQRVQRSGPAARPTPGAV